MFLYDMENIKALQKQGKKKIETFIKKKTKKRYTRK